MHVDDETPTPSTPPEVHEPARGGASSPDARRRDSSIDPQPSANPRAGGGATAAEVVRVDADRLATPPDEPPVVVRLVVEIRSDGTRTIARGAAEDAVHGEKVALEVAGSTPLQLALSLMKTLTQIPALAKSNARQWLPGRRR